MKRAENSDIVAIGETGLDSITECTLEKQKKALIFQIELSRKLGEPLVIHCRGYSDEVFQMCKSMLPSTHKIHLHCFTGNVKQVDQWCQQFGKH